MNLFSLSGKSALITGGSRGLGKAMARGFAEAGADVVISSRSADELKEAADEIGEGLNVRVEWIAADMSDRAQVKALADEAVQRLGKIDILVNNAGINNPQPIDEITDEVWDKNVEVDLTACMAMARYLVPGMKQRKWGRLIYTSSVLGLGGREFGHAFQTQHDVAQVGDRGMAVIEVELVPEFFRGMAVHPLDAALNGIGRAAVPRQGIGGLLRWHGRHGDDAPAGLILTHRPEDLTRLLTITRAELYPPTA